MLLFPSFSTAVPVGYYFSVLVSRQTADSVLSSRMTSDAALFYRRPQSAPATLDFHPSPRSLFAPPCSTGQDPSSRSSLRSSAKERTPSLLFTIACALFPKTPGVSPRAFLQLFKFELIDSLTRNSFRCNTCSRSPRFDRNQPKSCASNSFRCNTYRLCARKPFIRNTYKNQGEGCQW